MMFVALVSFKIGNLNDEWFYILWACVWAIAVNIWFAKRFFV